MKTRAIIIVEIDLDPVPGTFHTMDSATEQIQAMLTNMVPHYNPEVRPVLVVEKH